MKGSKMVLLPKLTKMLEETGENIKLARLRRKLTMDQVAVRAGVSRSTLQQVEKGKAGVSLGMYAQVLFVLGLEKDLLLIASNDVVGRKLQDVELLVKKKKATKEML
ncbi:hypothetical protein EZS27_041326 [termite gut metagenome]|uniref:HTH cro/C1-type domain-containing protein n=1 Tax=termite gut metagenome TaxID=433724 RepID=A0A5J4PEV7_9ZZZZ